MEITSKFSGRPPKITREAVRFLTRQAHFSIEKARRELGYQPRFSLEEGMKLTEQWLREAGYLPMFRRDRCVGGALDLTAPRAKMKNECGHLFLE